MISAAVVFSLVFAVIFRGLPISVTFNIKVHFGYSFDESQIGFSPHSLPFSQTPPVRFFRHCCWGKFTNFSCLSLIS